MILQIPLWNVRLLALSPAPVLTPAPLFLVSAADLWFALLNAAILPGGKCSQSPLCCLPRDRGNRKESPYAMKVLDTFVGLEAADFFVQSRFCIAAGNSLWPLVSLLMSS